MACTIVSPRPVPSIARSWAVVARKNGDERRCSATGSDAVVRDGRTNRRSHAQATTTAAAVLGELDGVRDEVVEQLSETGRVTRHVRHGVGVEPQIDVARRCGRPEGLDRMGREIGEIDVLGLECELPGFDLRNEEQIAHEPQEPAGMRFDD